MPFQRQFYAAGTQAQAKTPTATRHGRVTVR
jgi:hypothetical protein